MLRPDQVSAAIKAGVNRKLSDGRGLYLVVKNGRGFWVYQFWNFGPTKGNPIPHGHTRSKCLGTVAQFTPAAARRARDAFAVAWREGREVATRGRKKGDLFSTATIAYLENHADEWNLRHRAGLKALVRKYVPADFGARPVTAIKSEHVADVLRPIWNGPGNNRGTRLRRLIEGILNAKQVEPNPAAWSRLKEHLSRKRAEVVERAAMPAPDIPAFVATHAPADGDIEQRALRFVILTAARRKEVLEAKWNEFDLTNSIWTIPASRMKMRRPHAVPLTGAMMACLGERGAEDGYVFPSTRTGGVMGHEALKMKDFGYTLHGFRSSFGTWAEEQDDGRMYPARVIDAALAHGKENAVTAAYLRSDLFQARRKLMEHWSRFVSARTHSGDQQLMSVMGRISDSTRTLRDFR
jgi:integrase